MLGQRPLLTICCPVPFHVSCFHLLPLPSWAILTFIDLCDFSDYVQMGRKFLKYCTNYNQKCKKIYIFSKYDSCRQCKPLEAAPCILQPYASSFISSIPRHHHYHHQRRWPSWPSLPIWISCSASDSNVYSAIKTKPIKGNGSGARHRRGGRSGGESL